MGQRSLPRVGFHVSGITLNRAVLSATAVANDAEQRKTVKYRLKASSYRFTATAVKTLRTFGDLRRRIASVTAELRSSQFLVQRSSVTLQRV